MPQPQIELKFSSVEEGKRRMVESVLLRPQATQLIYMRAERVIQAKAKLYKRQVIPYQPMTYKHTYESHNPQSAVRRSTCAVSKPILEAFYLGTLGNLGRLGIIHRKGPNVLKERRRKGGKWDIAVKLKEGNETVW